MKLEYVPLLEIQRELYRIPRGRARFEAYLRVMTTEDRDDLALAPLAAMNPMGKDHIPALLDEYLALDAEGIGARAVEEAAPPVAGVPGEFKVGLVLADDLLGGWTNRYASELGLYFPSRVGTDAAAHKQYRRWLSAVLWTSEAPSAQAVSEAVLRPIYRAAYAHRHGVPRTLGDVLAQEGDVAAAAGCTSPMLDPEDLEYTRGVLAPLLLTEDWPTIVAGVFGDAAARELGYRPLGLSHRAGLALALHDVRAAPA